MTRHVVLLTDAYEAPATALTDVLHGAGIAAFVEGIRETDSVAAVPAGDDDGKQDENVAPIAVLYEVFPGADMRDLYSIIEHVTAVWPNVPLVACRRQADSSTGQKLRTLDTATLRRVGFRAIAEEPAQLPALLRELEERGMTRELPDLAEIQRTWLPEALELQSSIRARELRAAFELVVSLHFTSDQINAANAALAGLSSIVEADRWTIYLTSETGRGQQTTLEPLAVREASSVEHLTPEKNLQRTLLGKALALSGSESKTSREVLVKTSSIRKTEGGRRVVAIPLVSGDRVMGVLEGIREAGARAFTKTNVRLLDALALPIASALGNSLRIAEAERLSQTDDLTKLHNARYLRQFLLTEVRRARRYNANVGALFFDLDDFKNVNDVHGHLVGSHVLMEMAAVILSSVRDTDVVARYGGDEFVVILPESNIDQAAFVAERVRQKIERNRFAGGRGLRLHLTASFGVATFPLHAQSPQQLVANADAAMYEAKAAGKNCIRFPATTAPTDRERSPADQRNRRANEETEVTVD